MFLGTPAFAVPSLDALARLRDRGEIDLVGVVTRPDRPGHRGRITAPPVKERAVALGIPVLQPARLRGGALREAIDLRPHALVWAAYGNLVPEALLDAATGRALNVHPSLLPRWRGAEPVAHAILAGDTRTGVTLMEGTVDLDAGAIVAQAEVAVAAETTGELEARLAELGARLLERELLPYLRGEASPVPQDPARVTWAPKLDPKGGELDLERPAEELGRVVRAYTPDPGAFTTFRGQRIGVLRVSVAGGPPAEHGVLSLRAGVPHVAAGAGWLRLDEVKPAGKRAMSGADWARGLHDLEGARLPS
ncbi:MAG: methionyl-tRNA formyltransferase [Chloroflexota bacterium]|nr:methionyl-tRNA formyltransferase [Chloroflexota bacterium]